MSPSSNATSAPAPGTPGEHRVRICVVCTGNICRSPIGEKVLQAAFEQAGLADRVLITSAGTGAWHVGDGAHRGSVRVLERHGYPTVHAARQIDVGDLPELDLVLVADRGHLRTIRGYATQASTDPDRVVLIRSFDSDADGDEVPDPYGRGDADFERVLQMLEAAAPGIVDHVRGSLLGSGASW